MAISKAINDVHIAERTGKGLRSRLYNFFCTTCTNPTKVSVPDRFTGGCYDMYVPCGKCDQCRNTHGNMLASRMYLDVEVLHHCYFITLHFKGYDDPQSIPPQLHGMCWHRDAHNSTNHLQFHPCLLDYSVFQRFLAKLRMRLRRKFKGEVVQLSYTIGTEYGSRFGRPHAHLILICSHDVTKEDVESCWSYNGRQLGSLDFQDLVSNGTMGNLGRYSAKQCFKYVAKYATKNDAQFCRKRYDIGVSYLKERFNLPKSEWTFNPDDFVFDLTPYIYELKKSSYNEQLKNQRKNSADGYSDRGLRLNVFNFQKFGNQSERYYQQRLPEAYESSWSLDVWDDFVCLLIFGQKTRLSSGCPLGKVWFEKNRDSIVGGCRSLPKTPQPHSIASYDRQRYLNAGKLKDQGWKLSWPSQYNTWLARIKEPICIRQKMPTGCTQYKKINVGIVEALDFLRSLSEFAFAGREDIVSFTHRFCEDAGSNIVPLRCMLSAFPTKFQYSLSYVVGIRSHREQSFEDSCLFDRRDNSYLFPIVLCDSLGNPMEIAFQSYCYDRSTRDYVYCDVRSLDSVYQVIKSGFDSSLIEHELHAGEREAKYRAYEISRSHAEDTAAVLEQHKLNWQLWREKMIDKQQFFDED